jgi:pimeloyl-ACP methyl ester carboxylesterase
MTSTQLTHEPKEISLPTGVRLRYLDLGPSNGEPLLLLHGYSDSWFSFSRIIGLLPPNLRLIIPDQRGHGDSQSPRTGYRPDDFAADGLALLNGLGLASATVIGHSMGSFVAQRMVVMAPQRIAGLVLVGSAITPRNDTVLSLVPIVHTFTDPVDVGFIREFQMSTIHRPVPPEFLERVIAESQKLPAQVWKGVLAGLLDMPLLLDPVPCPVSIFWGDKDAIFGRSDQEDILRRIPHARLHIFNEVGHDPHWEVPEEFTRRLLEEMA